ncbi:Ger(x)C family spore germination protein [Cerasibacillus terrae]|uniref:Ger(X)C family spore germination protein n=2 Tax=Cerasibacillus terrae TaxID=2498845 RepID=A0A5C8NIK5_9BACI|nr:Ger(x)C family spore germination protein [Cerasibacillus terrae]
MIQGLVRNMNKRRVLLLITGLIGFLSGCWDSHEPERMLYTHGVGIDYKDGEYQVYLQIINFPNIAKSEDPKSEPEQVEVGYASGKTVEEAVFELYDSVDQRILWGHLSFIVLHENALKDKRLNSIIDNFLRYAETRYRIWIYSTTDSVKDILLAVPIISKSVILSKLGDPMNAYDQDSFIEPINLRSFIIGLDEPTHEMTIPQIRITHNWESVTEKTRITEFIGVSVATPNKFKGSILGEKAHGLRWMNNNTQRSSISFFLNEENKENKTSVALDKVKVKVKPIIENGEALFDIHVRMQANVNTLTKKTTEKELKKRIKEIVKKEILATYEEALEKEIDIYRLSEYLYRKNVKEWKKLEENGKVDLTEDSIRSLNIDITKVKTGRKSLTDTLK